MEQKEELKVMIFGVFDGMHKGHRHFIEEARSMGSPIVVVAQDSIVYALKNKNPMNSLNERMQSISREFPYARVIPGDTLLNSWQVILSEKPNIILLGYDQVLMEKTLRICIEQNNLPIRVERATSLEPDKYHTSILNNN